MINLSQEIPILDYTAVNTFLKNSLVKVFTISQRIELHILANIGIDNVIEVFIVFARVIVVVS